MLWTIKINYWRFLGRLSRNDTIANTNSFWDQYFSVNQSDLSERKERINKLLGSDQRLCLKILPSWKNEIYLWKMATKKVFYLSEIISIKTEAKWKLGRACFHSYQAADILIENNNNNDNNQLHVFPCDFVPCYSFTWFPKSDCYFSPQADTHFLEYQLRDFGVIWQ